MWEIKSVSVTCSAIFSHCYVTCLKIKQWRSMIEYFSLFEYQTCQQLFSSVNKRRHSNKEDIWFTFLLLLHANWVRSTSLPNVSSRGQQWSQGDLDIQTKKGKTRHGFSRSPLWLDLKKVFMCCWQYAKICCSLCREWSAPKMETCCYD